MSLRFDPRHGLVVVPAELEGTSGTVVLRLALDTGASRTLVNVAPLLAIGYDPALAPERVQVTTGSGVEFAPRLTLSRIRSLGRERADFPVLCHTLPPSATVDGLLGLDFFRGHVLHLDFRDDRVTLT